MGKEKFSSINGLRAISIIIVIIHHLELKYEIFTRLRDIKLLYPVINFLTDGHFGVNVFFVISGFLITSLMLQEEAKTKTVSLKNFYIRRTLRIFPAYYFLLLFYLLIQHYGVISISHASWLTSITYTKYFNWNLDWYTSHFWSLSVEEHFYLFWPLVFVFAKRIRTHVALALFLVVPFIRIFAHYHTISWLNDLTIFLRIDAIAIGCLFALHKDWILARLSKNWSLVFWTSIVVFICWTNLGLLSYQYKLHSGPLFIPLGIGDGTIANIVIAVIMMYSVFGPRKQWYTFLNLKWMNFIGILSYSIYLWQQFFLNNTGQFYNTLPVNLIFIVMAALFSYYLIEKPFLKLKSKFSKTATGKPTPTPENLFSVKSTQNFS
ncbi:MAG: acyltransferase [Bacteroidota bacterium]